MASRMTALLALILLVLTYSVSLVIADHNQGRWQNARDYDPIVLKGEEIPALDKWPINELYLYIYEEKSNSWNPILFQIDEKDDSSHFWVPNPNHLFDNNDELVFMAKDMGDRAPDASYWIEDPDSKNYDRVEIIVTDPLTNQYAWAYIYRSKNNLPVASESYMDYKVDTAGKGADTVLARGYIESHNTGGIPTEWILLEGTGINILDRQKVLIRMLLYGFIELSIREDLLESFFSKIEKIVGPIRVVREVIWYINIGMGIEPFEFSLPLKYYPYSIESGGVSGTLETSDHVNYIRQSFDLTPGASGMRLYNPYNKNGILIDGSGGAESVKDTLDDAPVVNWWLISGAQGSYSLIFRMTPIGTKRSLYYEDDKTVLKEGEDTGDMMRWGDTGIKIEGKDIAGRISFAYKAYYMGPDQPYNTGETLAQNFASPLEIQTQVSFYIPVELTLFTAMESEGKVVLEWMTATETNNYGFEVQRKISDQPGWEKTGFVNGNGTTVTPHKYSFVDESVSIGMYYYRLKQIDVDGSFEFSDEILIAINAPKTFSLYQNYPNPFNPVTLIRYQIPDLNQALVPVDFRIYNLLGNEVRTLVQKDQGAGYYSVTWDGKNNQGETVSAGTYIYQLRAGDVIKTQKMLLLR